MGQFSVFYNTPRGLTCLNCLQRTHVKGVQFTFIPLVKRCVSYRGLSPWGRRNRIIKFTLYTTRECLRINQIDRESLDGIFLYFPFVLVWVLSTLIAPSCWVLSLKIRLHTYAFNLFSLLVFLLLFLFTCIDFLEDVFFFNPK